MKKWKLFTGLLILTVFMIHGSAWGAQETAEEGDWTLVLTVNPELVCVDPVGGGGLVSCLASLSCKGGDPDPAKDVYIKISDPWNNWGDL